LRHLGPAAQRVDRDQHLIEEKERLKLDDKRRGDRARHEQGAHQIQGYRERIDLLERHAKRAALGKDELLDAPDAVLQIELLDLLDTTKVVRPVAAAEYSRAPGDKPP